MDFMMDNAKSTNRVNEPGNPEAHLLSPTQQNDDIPSKRIAFKTEDYFRMRWFTTTQSTFHIITFTSTI
ncbi:hypothetical protein BgiMline_013166 [Biomphalaria glabrata]|nr:hypothetical protein BgiMline_016980 [Biomphalaria glabrata]